MQHYTLTEAAATCRCAASRIDAFGEWDERTAINRLEVACWEAATWLHAVAYRRAVWTTGVSASRGRVSP